jgi:hypothetical protein
MLNTGILVDLIKRITRPITVHFCTKIINLFFETTFTLLLNKTTFLNSEQAIRHIVINKILMRPAQI